tara:strand:+ start:4533 stop:7361 length:2829 start_codon:yes stop_codon:yes gene_type:complete
MNLIHKGKSIGLLTMLLVFVFSINVWSQKIIYPWRVTTEIVRSGESFEVWFISDGSQTVNSVELVGPYNTVHTTKTVETGTWEYDANSHNTYDTKITVTVPPNAPGDRYDLVLKTSAGDVVSRKAVKIVKEYKSSYYVMHFSDAHRWHKIPENLEIGVDVSEQSYEGMRAVNALINASNIIDPEIIIETGDNVYNINHNGHAGHPDVQETFQFGWAPENLKGTAGAFAATWAVAGNHDAPGNKFNGQPLDKLGEYYNQYFGVQSFNIKYGNARFMGMNAGWYSYNFPEQDATAKNWINTVGKGNLRVSMGHDPARFNSIYNTMKSNNTGLSLILAGHTHTPSKNPLSVGGEAIQYVAASVKDKGNAAPFNLYKINNYTGAYETVGNAKSAHKLLKNSNDYNSVKLKLTYSNLNDGVSTSNSATIVNDFEFPIEGARVRFVLSKGYAYIVTNGTITQQFDGDNFHIVDLSVDLNAGSTTVVSIESGDLCPDDPNKLEPGLCGCGVEEGTCPDSTLTVNNGTGAGTYAPFEEVNITANAAPAGEEFDKWIINSGNPTILYSENPSTTMTVGSSNAEITAAYKELPKVNGATFVSQQIPTLIPGETVSVSITMKNTGTSTWTKANHYLGSQSPEGNQHWGINRVELEEGERILPEDEKTFTFDITAPSQDGRFIFQWKMIEEGVELFGEVSSIQPFAVGDSENYFDDCDSKTSWNPGDVIMNGTNKVQGIAALEKSGTATPEFYKVLTSPYNAKGTESGTVLQFWYYVSDPLLFQSTNQVEIGSSGGPDVNEYSWSLSSLSAGWNFIQLNTSEADKIGNPDLSAINWFRIYRRKDGLVTTRIDAIQLIGENSLSIGDIGVEKSFHIFPNPSDEEIFVNFMLSNSAVVSITLINSNGQIVSQRISNQKLNPGSHNIEVDVCTLKPGVYFARLKIEDTVFTRKIVIK